MEHLDDDGLGLICSLRRFWITWWRSIVTEFATSSKFSIGMKRILVLVVLFVFISMLMIWNHLGFALDSLLFASRIGRESSKNILFIVSNARSGSTVVARALVERDKEHFTGPMLWEVLFAASVSWRLLFHLFGRIDSLLLEGMSQRLLQRLDRRFLMEKTKRYHAFSLFSAEEDEWFMIHVGCCQLTALVLPFLEGYSPLIWFDRDMPTRDQQALWNYYKLCVKRHRVAHRLIERSIPSLLDEPSPSSSSPSLILRASKLKNFIWAVQHAVRAEEEEEPSCFEPHRNTQKQGDGTHAITRSVNGHFHGRTSSGEEGKGGERFYVSKNPTFTLRLASILENFSEPRFLVLVRDPYEAIPSMVSYISAWWHVFAQPAEPFPFKDELQAMCSLHYTHPVEVQAKKPLSQGRFLYIDYESLRENLVHSIASLYSFLQLKHQRNPGGEGKENDEDDKENEEEEEYVLHQKFGSMAEEAKMHESGHHYDFGAATGCRNVMEFENKHAEAFKLYSRYSVVAHC